MSGTPRTYGGVSGEDRVSGRREKLLEAGLELLGRDGWNATTVRAVCAEARLTERYFYESFANRDELLVAIFDRVAAEAATAVLEAVDAAPHDARAKSRAAIGSFVELLSDDPRRARAMLIESIGSPVLEHRREEWARSFAALLGEQARRFYGAESLSESDSELTSLALVGALSELLVAWLDGRLEVSKERLVEHCVELFVAAASVRSGSI
jgi:AcrR family transcriptional regulator